jgi:hypothetical protein
MIRELITRFNKSLSERMVSSRRRYTAPVRIWFDPDSKTERALDAARAACILGETVDLSRTGVGFLAPSIRVREKYLVGHERPLNIEIDLPNGRVRLRAIGRRYEKVGVHISTERFLVGAHILSISDPDKETYESFLRKGPKVAKRPHGNLELGID